jgi:hypothetical protein
MRSMSNHSTKGKFRSGKASISRPYQPSDEQYQSIVQVELRTLPACKIQIPAGGEKHGTSGRN